MTSHSEPDTTVDVFEINPAVKLAIDGWLAKYPPERKQSALLSALLLVQAQNGGWLSQAAMRAVAHYLDLPDIVVFEAATFYDLYNLSPIGKYKISICTNVSCLLAGCDRVVDAVKAKLGIGLGETTADGLFTVREVECMAACAAAPMCQVNDQHYYEQLTPESMVRLLDELAAQAPRDGGSHVG